MTNKASFFFQHRDNLIDYIVLDQSNMDIIYLGDVNRNNIENSDLLIVLGTSLEVYTVNQLPLVAKGETVLIEEIA